MVTDGSRDYAIDDTYNILPASGDTVIAFHSPTYESTFALKRVTLDDAKTAFPLSPRTFPSVEDLEDKIAMGLHDSMSYKPQELSHADVVSFTFDGDNALELIKVTEDGDMTYRDNGQWEEVSDNQNYPTIFDRDLIDIEPDDVDKAVAFWDANSGSEKGVTKEQMLPFAALVQ